MQVAHPSSRRGRSPLTNGALFRSTGGSPGSITASRTGASWSLQSMKTTRPLMRTLSRSLGQESRAPRHNAFCGLHRLICVRPVGGPSMAVHPPSTNSVLPLT
jgi:hypothetical protein